MDFPQSPCRFPSDLRHVPRTEREENIPRFQEGNDLVDDPLPFLEVTNLATGFLHHLPNEFFRIDPRDRLFSGGIDVGHEQEIGRIERGQKFVEEIFRPRVAVGLKKGDEPPLKRPFHRFEGRPDLFRVVAVVIDHRDLWR